MLAVRLYGAAVKRILDEHFPICVSGRPVFPRPSEAETVVDLNRLGPNFGPDSLVWVPDDVCTARHVVNPKIHPPEHAAAKLLLELCGRFARFAGQPPTWRPLQSRFPEVYVSEPRLGTVEIYAWVGVWTPTTYGALVERDAARTRRTTGHAVQEQEADAVDVRQPPGDGEAVG